MEDDEPALGEEGELLASTRQKRTFARPLLLDSSVCVLCHEYKRERHQGGPSSQYRSEAARSAQLCYFLPENWSASYQFTVFEGSYILAFLPAETGAAEHGPQFHLARPLHAVSSPCDTASSLPEFELVWPLQLDNALIEAVQHVCGRAAAAGNKRKAHEPESSLAAVHVKLRKLAM